MWIGNALDSAHYLLQRSSHSLRKSPQTKTGAISDSGFFISMFI